MLGTFDSKRQLKSHSHSCKGKKNTAFLFLSVVTQLQGATILSVIEFQDTVFSTGLLAEGFYL